MSEGPVVVDVLVAEGGALEVRLEGWRVRLVAIVDGQELGAVELSAARATRVAIALRRAAHLAQAQERDPP